MANRSPSGAAEPACDTLGRPTLGRGMGSGPYDVTVRWTSKEFVSDALSARERLAKPIPSPFADLPLRSHYKASAPGGDRALRGALGSSVAAGRSRRNQRAGHPPHAWFLNGCPLGAISRTPWPNARTLLCFAVPLLEAPQCLDFLCQPLLHANPVAVGHRQTGNKPKSRNWAAHERKVGDVVHNA